MPHATCNCEGTPRRDFLRLGVGTFLGMSFVDLIGHRAKAVEVFKAERPGVTMLDLGLPPSPNGPEEGLAALSAILGHPSRRQATGLGGRRYLAFCVRPPRSRRPEPRLDRLAEMERGRLLVV